MPIEQRVLDSLRVLFSDVVTRARFQHWKEGHQQVSNLVEAYVFGEIFWRKSLGRPKTTRLSEAVSVHSWRTTKIINGTPAGLAAVWINVHHYPTWWDGKDDGDYWRVPYLISDIPDGQRHDPVFGNFDETTFIIPEFEGVPWVAGGDFEVANSGMRVFVPRDAVFVKESGATHVSFEIVSRIAAGDDQDLPHES